MALWCCQVSKLPRHWLLQVFCLHNNHVQPWVQERKKYLGLRLGWGVGGQRGDLDSCFVAEQSNDRFNWWQNDTGIWTEALAFPIWIFLTVCWSNDSGRDAEACVNQLDATAAAVVPQQCLCRERKRVRLRKESPLTFPLVMEVFVQKVRRHKRIHERKEKAV